MFHVCGVTFDHTTNYGSCFQAYALQTAIEKMAVNGERCSYDLLPRASFPVAAKKGKVSFPLRVKRSLLALLTRERRAQFRKFEDKHMHYADCHSRQDLTLLNDRYDAFVCGSDVIWNFSYTNADEVFFLDFADKYKFSYAASFGKADIHYEFDSVRLKEKPEDIYGRNISKLDAVGVREKNAVGIAQQFTEKTPVQVCDPVLLLTRDDWSGVCSENGIPKKPYIFAYNTSIKPNFTWFLETLQRETGLPVIHVTWEASDAIKQRAFAFPVPQKWLGLLKNAEYVVTNSFHATAFAAIFHKKFFTVMQDGRGARTNIRIYDFLERLGLSDRIVNSKDAAIRYEEPDFSLADETIRGEREFGLAFLQDNLDAAGRRREGKQS